MQRIWVLISILLVAALAFGAVGCGGDDDDATPAPTLTGAATATPEPTNQGYTGGKHTFKVNHTNPPGHPVDLLWKYIEERLDYYTDGQVKLEIFPAASLYGTFDAWYALATGALDIASLADFALMGAGFLDYQIGYLNFFWGNTVEDAFSHTKRFWEHPDGGKTMFNLTDKAGVKVLAAFPSGVLQVVMNKFGMDSMWDLKGKKISGVGGLIGLFTEVTGSTQVMIDPSEFNLAFTQGLLDVSAVGPESAITNRFYEIADNGFVISALVSQIYWGMDLNLWNSLSPELQDIIQNKIIPEALDWSYEKRPVDEFDALEELEANGVTLLYQDNAERMDLRGQSWETGRDQGYYKGMSEDLMKLADRLRSEPYDEQELSFP